MEEKRKLLGKAQPAQGEDKPWHNKGKDFKNHGNKNFGSGRFNNGRFNDKRPPTVAFAQGKRAAEAHANNGAAKQLKFEDARGPATPVAAVAATGAGAGPSDPLKRKNAEWKVNNLPCPIFETIGFKAVAKLQAEGSPLAPAIMQQAKEYGACFHCYRCHRAADCPAVKK
jgi:hypothetical protein